MTYVVDLTALLISLFNIEPGDELTWTDLKKAYDEGSGSRQRIHRRICVDFKQDQQILGTDGFKSLYVDLVKDAGPHPERNRIEGRSTRAEDARVPVLSPASSTSVTSAMSATSATSAASARSSTPRSPRASSSFGRLLKTFSFEKR